jgi:hypothetical protein
MSESSDSDSSTATTVTISLEQFQELKKYEEIVLAERERAKKRFAVLAEKRDPVEYAKHKLEKYHANRDAILARRRELRAAKKATATVTA